MNKYLKKLRDACGQVRKMISVWGGLGRAANPDLIPHLQALVDFVEHGPADEELGRVALECAGAAWGLKPFEHIVMDEVEAKQFAAFIEKQIRELFLPRPKPKPRTPEEVMDEIDDRVRSGRWEDGMNRENILVLLDDLVKSGGEPKA